MCSEPNFPSPPTDPSDVDIPSIQRHTLEIVACGLRAQEYKI